MRNEWKILTKAGIVAVIAALPFGVPAQAGNMVYNSDFTTDRSVPGVSRRDGTAAIMLLNELIGVTDRTQTLGSRSDSRPNHPNSSNFAYPASYVNAEAPGFVIRTNSIAASSDLISTAVLGGPGFVLDDFFNPSTGSNETNPMNSAVVDIGDVASLDGTGGGIDLDPIQMLGSVSVSIAKYGNIGSSKVAQKFEAMPDLTRENQDRPLVIKWIQSLFKAVSISSQCSNPDGCGSRLVVKE